MSETASPVQMFNEREPIPGYVLTKRLGVGGNGEVWHSDAPGGLGKAVKLVYGYMDDERAARELKSLNRVKQVRHPFLISLERIEVIDGHLVIVTELADGSVKDRFDECRSAGLPGIPRDELLGYLRDAADALDFMCEKHSLQHLDVKPENLLLVSGRAKIADFGLVKDIADASRSLMSGLTPVYASPESFDGRANQYSDQYSLAIAYQEMLTGVLPFAGRTAAQLAAQHLNSPPDVSSLPPCDQPAIIKTLAKIPHQRFSNCRAMVDSLSESTPSTTIPATQGSQPHVAGDQPTDHPTTNGDTTPSAGSDVRKTMPLGEDFANQLNSAAIETDEPILKAEVELLDRIDDLPNGTYNYRPTLIIGLGGTGAAVLRQLRVRLHQRYGDTSSVPSIQMLLFDTDVSAIQTILRTSSATGLGIEETVSVPLRGSAEYRTDSQKLLKSISRRWVYNIPRSLRTEGLRPLGRLAFVDHAQTIIERLRVAISAAISEQAMTESSQGTGNTFAGPPRVFLVSSMAGGTGGGMFLDMAYAVRTVLSEFGVPDDEVYGVLTHSSDRRASSQDLANVNTFASLNELHDFSRLGGQYPGDPASGLPAFSGNQVTFRHAYFVHLGDRQTDEEFSNTTGLLADFLYRNCASPTGQFFDKCREHDYTKSTSWSGETILRTLGFGTVDLSENRLVNSGSSLNLVMSRIQHGTEISIPQIAVSSGGALRLLVTLPLGYADSTDELLRILSPASLMFDVQHKAVLFWEGERLPLSSVARNIVDNRDDYVDLASRVHTRVDVNWSRL